MLTYRMYVLYVAISLVVGLGAALGGAGFDVYYPKQLFNLQYLIIIPGAFHWMMIRNGWNPIGKIMASFMPTIMTFIANTKTSLLP